MAEITGRNFILTDELSGKVTILSHQQVSVAEAYEAFLSALQQAGYTTVTVGQVTKVVPADSAANNPLRIYEGGDIPYTDNYVTQIIQLENVLVGDISSVVKELAGKGARIIAYAPTNTLIITDAAVNIRRVYRIISQLDVASPKARLEFVPLRYAQATDIQRIIQDLYGGAGGSSGGGSSAGSSPGAAGAGAAKGRRAGARGGAAAGADAGASSSQVGSEGSYIEKIIADERTNSLVVLANDEAIQAVKDLIAQLDIDVDPSSRAQIHVIYLEHAKAEEVAQVLSNLSQAANQTGRGTQGTRGSSRGQQRPGARPTAPAAQRGPASGDGPAAEGEGASAVAAFGWPTTRTPTRSCSSRRATSWPSSSKWWTSSTFGASRSSSRPSSSSCPPRTTRRGASASTSANPTPKAAST
jgi:general secretion pathway protein D